MPIPPILRCMTAADVQREFGLACAQPALDFSPGHLIGPVIVDGCARDTVGSWHLYSEGGSAMRVRTSYGQSDGFCRWGFSTVHLAARAWASRTIGHWSLLLDEAIFLIVSCTQTGGGGYYAGNLRGPGADQLPQQAGNGIEYGTDQGWAISFNGTPGGINGIGFANYADTCPTSPNSDTNSDGSSNVEGLGFLPFFIGNDAANQKSYLRGSSAKWRIEEAAPVPGGNYASPDGYAAIGRTNYGLATNFTNYGSAVCVLLAHFSGNAARNIHTYGATIAAAIGATL